ncbi:MAG: histone deacetylase [Planctomycetota bacterium]|nr:histone deacetylase [Planctomycetota bacterium]
MRVYYADHQRVELPAGHRFPMGKYARLRLELVAQGVLREDELIPAPAIERAAIERVHDAAYVEAFLTGRLDPKARQRIGFPWSQALVRRTLASAGGTCAASDAALEDGVSGVLAGGTHHAFRDRGGGYCVFNDVAIAAVRLLDAGRVARVLAFDVDVHQGDGTAAIFQDDPRVFTVSVHGAKNFPLRKETSDLDVPLPDGTDDGPYLEAVEGAFEQALAAGSFDLAFVQAGVDPLVSDRLGRLAVSLEGLARRDSLVLGGLAARGVPAVLTLGGGYAEPIEESIQAHVGTYRAATEVLARRS